MEQSLAVGTSEQLDGIKQQSLRERQQAQMRPKQRKMSSRSKLSQVVAVGATGLVLFVFGACVCSASETKTTPQAPVTQSYSEAIKWSFGGWAPLDGAQKIAAAAAAKNSTQQADDKRAAQPSQLSATAAPQRHKAAQHQTPPAASRQQQPIESLKESASNPHEGAHFVVPEQMPPQESPYGQQHHPNQMSHNTHQHHRQQQQQIHPRPAYAMQHQRPMAQFSPPAPAPIVREHLLPAGGPGQHQSEAKYQIGASAPYMAHAAFQHQQMAHGMPRQEARAPMHLRAMHHAPRHGPPPHFKQQQQHEMMQANQQRHRQHMMRHHKMVQGEQHRAHQMHLMHQGGAPPPQHQNMVPHRHHQQMHHQIALQPHQIAQPPPEGLSSHFKLVEGEQPILFSSNSLPADQVPVLEVEHSSPSAGRHHQLQHQQARNQPQHQQQLSNTSSNSAEAYGAAAIAAIENENLNYQAALSQVAQGEQHVEQDRQRPHEKQSNNIQDIKMRQQYEQQRQAAPSRDEAGQPKTSSTKSPYLTIPVAVETEGDKVLTPEDINEIEKHVINVLPNLRTADKIVKIADTQLNLAKAAMGATKSPPSQGGYTHSQSAGPAPTSNGLETQHEANYEEHKSTIAQLEADGGNRRPQGYSQPQVSQMPQPVNQASTASAHHQPADEQQQQLIAEQQYFVAAGPPQEVGTMDADQISEYNLIKNDLLGGFRYEPTRAASGAPSSQNQQDGRQPQTGSTPPMSHTSASPAPNFGNNRQVSQATRYFGQPRGNGQPRQLFGRLRAPTGAQQQLTMTTTTSRGAQLGGRKVSEVMRPLIRTTPVPMTSPMHVSSVEPEKLDAIQLIAGHANDERPIVVEAHQLVGHTPDGGIDYNSGAPRQPQVEDTNMVMGANQTGQQQHSPPPQDDGQGAIIEYVAMNEQQLSNAVNEQHRQQQQRAQYEAAPQEANAQQPQQGDAQSPFMYAYTMTTQHQQRPSEHASTPGGYVSGGAGGEPAAQQAATQPPPTTPHMFAGQHQQPQQADGEQRPSLAWSPSIASDHQQQQLELSGHAAPIQQVDLPATAGYNLFGQTTTTAAAGQDASQQQQQSNEFADQPTKWRTKAGGSQPNPDAQYDGQIVKSEHEDDSSQQEAGDGQQSAELSEQQQQQLGNGYEQHNGDAQAAELARLGPLGGAGHEDERQQQQIEPQSGYEQQQQSYQGQTSAAPTRAAYLATDSLVGGAQINHAPTAPPRANNQQQYSYAKLDSQGQQQHLEQQQAQHQAQVAEMMSRANGQDSAGYQTTTPSATLTTVAQETDARRAQQEEAQQQQQQVPENGDSNEGNEQLSSNEGAQGDYAAEQQQRQLDQSRPSVQSLPESLLVNEAPMQVPLLDQQSLISGAEMLAGGAQQESHSFGDGGESLSGDGEQRPASLGQAAGVYQVYQAYYAPKDHKPLPGYVRLSLDEFNELFKDAEIQYVDRNLSGGAMGRQAQINGNQQQMIATPHEQLSGNAYQQGDQPALDTMRAASSESQSIVVDRRSLSELRAPNSTTSAPQVAKIAPNETTTTAATTTTSNDKSDAAANLARRAKLGQAVRKIISIRNSRQLAKQTKASKLVMKRVKSSAIVGSPTNSTQPAPTKLAKQSVKAKSLHKKTSSGGSKPVGELDGQDKINSKSELEAKSGLTGGKQFEKNWMKPLQRRRK